MGMLTDEMTDVLKSILKNKAVVEQGPVPDCYYVYVEDSYLTELVGTTDDTEQMELLKEAVLKKFTEKYPEAGTPLLQIRLQTEHIKKQEKITKIEKLLG